MDRVARILAEPEKHRVLVVGLARSGVSAAQALHKIGAQVVGTDRNADIKGLDPLQELDIQLALGGERTELVNNADLLVLSPGVPTMPITAPIPAKARAAGVPIIGELELAYRLLGGHEKLKTMAVTGTNGKSTTTSLCSHLLTQAGNRVFTGGNIGKPFCDLFLIGEDVDWAVVEVSSFQLEHLSSPGAFVPHVGIWLNLTPDHLDRHVTMRNYGRMKRRLFEGMTPAETGIFFVDDSNVHHFHEELECTYSTVSRNPARVGPVGALLIRQEITPNGWDQPFILNNGRLAGDHNAENAACALCAALAVGLDAESIQAGLDTYPGLPHRLEPVQEVSGVLYINDSKATNPESVAKSLTSFSVPLVLIAGGRGKGTGYGSLRHIVEQRVAHLILLGEEADRMASDLDGCARIHRAADMAEAVGVAHGLARPGNVVLLSPACASFDMFKDYAERGEVFADLVRELPDA